MMTSNSRTTTPLTPALTSLRTSTSLLASSLSILSAGTRDLLRLSHVLSQTRHFELAPASSLAEAQTAVLAELKPEVERLLCAVENTIEKRERREEWLRARYALGQGRLNRDSGTQLEDRGSKRGTSAGAAEEARGPVDEAKARRLQQKRERLSYTVQRLQLEASQKERKLRQSMAFVKDEQEEMAKVRGYQEEERGPDSKNDEEDFDF